MLQVEATTHELVNHVRKSKISVKGSLGVGIQKEISVNLSAMESIALESNLGKVNKNEVTPNALAKALQVYRYMKMEASHERVSKINAVKSIHKRDKEKKSFHHSFDKRSAKTTG